MKAPNTAAPADPVLLALQAGWLAGGRGSATLLMAALALVLSLAGWRPAQTPVLTPAPVSPPPDLLPPVAQT